MNKTEPVRPDLMLTGLELRALSQLLIFWSSPASLERRRDQWRLKQPHFRKGVIAGAKLKRTKVPPELLSAEYHVLLPIVQKLKKSNKKPFVRGWLDGYTVPVGIGAGFRRHVPIPQSQTRLLYDALRNDHASEISLRLVEARLGCGAQTVKNAVAKVDRIPLKPTQAQLLSIFWDVVSIRPYRWEESAAAILNALFMSKASALTVFYAVQTASKLKQPTAAGICDTRTVRKMCRLICPAYARGPFDLASTKG